MKGRAKSGVGGSKRLVEREKRTWEQRKPMYRKWLPRGATKKLINP